MPAPLHYVVGRLRESDQDVTRHYREDGTLTENPSKAKRFKTQAAATLWAHRRKLPAGWVVFESTFG